MVDKNTLVHGMMLRCVIWGSTEIAQLIYDITNCFELVII